MKVKKMAKNRRFEMRKRKQKSLKKKPRNWFFKSFTSRFISLERKQVKEYQQESCRII